MSVWTLLPFLFACTLGKDAADTTLTDSDPAVSDTDGSGDYTIPDGVTPGECLYRVYLGDELVEDDEVWSIWFIDGLMLEARYGPALMGDDEWWFSYDYDADGRLVAEEEHQRDGGEVIDTYSSRRTYVYDAEGRLVAQTKDTDIDGVLEYTTHHIYDEEGQRVRMELIDEREGVLIEETFYTYDISGSIQTRTVEEYDSVEGVLTELSVTVEDTAAMSVSVMVDRDGDGVYNRLEEWEYNEYGDKTRYSEDTNADGIVEYQFDAEYSYNELGQIVEQFYDVGDGAGEITWYNYGPTNHIASSERYEIIADERVFDYRVTYDYSACDLTSIDW